MTDKNYITPAGFKALQDEFQKLRYQERPQIVETVAWAAGNGDRSENGDYIYGKKRLREIDSRLRYLSKQLDAAEVIDPAKTNASMVRFGATVTVLNEQDQEKTYAIVGMTEADPSKGKISWKSPLARALFNKHEGDSVEFNTPKGIQEVEIVKIEYREVI